MLRKGVKIIGSRGTSASLRIAQVGGRRRVGIGIPAHGRNTAGARDATRRLFARTLSRSQAINLRSETSLTVTGAITPLNSRETAPRVRVCAGASSVERRARALSIVSGVFAFGLSPIRTSTVRARHPHRCAPRGRAAAGGRRAGKTAPGSCPARGTPNPGQRGQHWPVCH